MTLAVYLSPVTEQTLLAVEVVKAVRAPVPPAFVRSVLVRATSVPEVRARLPEGTCSIAVRITGDSELRRLNKQYAGTDSVTDVLSFAGSDGHTGDLAISWPAVVRQAAEFGHAPFDELGLLCVHGLLHLLGWDHRTPAESKEMTRVTISALKLSALDLAPGRL
jgi:probable rRNA maturation factor